MNTKTPEERAAERFPYPEGIDQWLRSERKHFHSLCKPNRMAYATCIREEVEPLEAEVAKLRALVQELVNGLEWTMDQASFAMSKARLQITIHEYRRALQQASTALSAAKEHGFVPTNTQDNG